MTRLQAMLAGFVVAASSTLPQPSSAGSYLDVARCDEMLGCFAGSPDSDPNANVPPFAIVHPLGYEGEGGKIEIPVCVDDDDPSLIAPTQRAIDTWNALVARTQNCLGCIVWEELPSELGSAPFHAESVILHELGHCAMGLDHINMPFDEDDDGMHEGRSFTRSSDTIDIDIGPDGIRGSFDDDHFEPPPPPGNRADSVSWFRKADNDPVIVDGTVIDTDTYSRSVATNLPSGHSWGASANLVVAESLGEPFTQAVMYSVTVPEQLYSGLSADEVNMVKNGMTGEDREAGTADDYSVELVYVEDCATNPSAITVRFQSFQPNDPAAAACVGLGIDYAFPPPFPPNGPTHFKLVRKLIDFAEIRLDSGLCWDTGPPIAPIVFMDGFETGDLSGWDKTVPITADPVGGADLASLQPRRPQTARPARADSRSSSQLAGTCPPSVTEGP